MVRTIVDSRELPKKRLGLDLIAVFLFLAAFIFMAGFYSYSKALDKKIEQRKIEIRKLEQKIEELRPRHG